MELTEIVPWGRSLAEYRQMFALSERDLDKRILGCGDGPASFNAELTRQGGRVVSADPLYRFAREQIAARIEATSALVLGQVRQHHQQFVWAQISSVEQLAEIRHLAMQRFLADYVMGKQEGRYLDAQLPVLPFADNCFDLALCSHFLFLYSEQFSFALHLQSIVDLCRVATEVRVFPLVDLAGCESTHLSPLLAKLAELGYAARIEQVGYEFQRGADRMLRICSDN